MRTSIAVLISVLAVPHTVLPGQGVRVVDQGSFTLSVNGRMVGRETFRFRASTRGEQVIYTADGQVTFGDRTLQPELISDGTGAAVSYTVKVRRGSSDEKWEGTITRGRLNAGIRSAAGTAAREYMLPAGTLIIDDDIIHQHWFLALRAQDGRAAVLVPRRNNAQVMITVTKVGEERLRIGTVEVAATHYRATESAGEIHDLWVDGSNRLLKVAIPSRSLVAVRDDPPPA